MTLMLSVVGLRVRRCCQSNVCGLCCRLFCLVDVGCVCICVSLLLVRLKLLVVCFCRLRNLLMIAWSVLQVVSLLYLWYRDPFRWVCRLGDCRILCEPMWSCLSSFCVRGFWLIIGVTPVCTLLLVCSEVVCSVHNPHVTVVCARRWWLVWQSRSQLLLLPVALRMQ